MRNAMVIARRELASLLHTPGGYFIASATLLVQGLLFNTRAVGSRPKLSAQVLADFLVDASGTTTVAALLLSIRLLTDERQSATLPLLLTSPLKETEIIAGKFLSALTALTAIVLLSLYLPALIFVQGKVSLGHIAGGYFGLLLLGAAVLSLGLLASSLCRGPLLAGVLAALMVFALFVSWTLSQRIEPPWSNLLSHVSLYEGHFFPFVRGLVQWSDVLYYLSVIAVALTAAAHALAGERFR